MKYEQHKWRGGTKVYKDVLGNVRETQVPPSKSYEFDREALERLANLLQQQYPTGDAKYDLDEALDILTVEVKEKV